MIPELEDTFSMASSHVVLDQIDIAFDDEHAAAAAGLPLPAWLRRRASRRFTSAIQTRAQRYGGRSLVVRR
jgi:hypothetical protein